MVEKYYTTPAGYQRFLEKMMSVAARYDAIVASNEDAADAGDNSVWHDNFAYEENQRQMHQWAKRIQRMEEIKANLVVIDIDPRPEQVGVGCEAVVYDPSEDSEKTFAISGYEDGDPEKRRISYTFPPGPALLGAQAGDIRKVYIGKMETCACPKSFVNGHMLKEILVFDSK